ncbi:toll-like receptor 9, partial [Acipenser ruthenus]|uniref:toll-like receptor 9 n=1 Tax=Acipenser ruthenus TaxID=7906 RepID=UPI0027423515
LKACIHFLVTQRNSLIYPSLFICLLVPLARATLPKFFPCDDTDNSTVVVCSKRKLLEVPTISSSNVTTLYLDSNNIKLVKRDAFSALPGLQNLSIMWNCLPTRLRSPALPSCRMEIEPEAFVNLKNLVYLGLSGNSLTSVPQLPPSLKVLSLAYNNIVHLSHANFSGAQNLVNLNLDKNCYYNNPCGDTFDLKEDVFRDMHQLKVLSLKFNNITAVPRGLPQFLEDLDLRENKISRINSIDFANLTQLKILNLEWNCQRCDHAAQPCFPCLNNASINLDPNSFRNQRNLISLSLRGNSLRTLSDSLFEPLVNLSNLDLSDNLLAYAIVNGTFFSYLKKVKTLNLIFNYEPLQVFPTLQLSPHFQDMGSLECLLLTGYFFLTLEPTGLKPLMALRNLKKLDFRMNFLNEINMSMLTKIRTLKQVVLSENMLAFPPRCPSVINHSVNLPKEPEHNLLPGFTMSGLFQHPSQVNEEPDWDTDLIPQLRNLQYKYCNNRLSLDLSNNNIMSIHQDIFQGLEDVVCLDLSSNYISQPLNGSQFLPLKNLRFLNLAQNRIDLYYETAFQELNSTLMALDLTSNAYHFHMKGMGHRFTFIHHLKSLRSLSLAQNDIGIRISTRLESDSLNSLYFGGNRLDLMWDGQNDRYLRFFLNLTNLTFLDISNNHLRFLSKDAMNNLPKTLKILNVNHNKLIFFPWWCLENLSNLIHLNLSHNSLSTIPKETITFGSKLRILDLSYNSIKNLPEAFFQSASSLNFLNLSNNALKFLYSQSLPAQVLGNLTELAIHNNPFTCNCDSSWFIDFLKTTQVKIPHLTTYVTCEFPESQQGKAVLSMDPRSCQEILGNLGFLCTSFMTIIFTALPILKKLYGWDCWYFIHIFWVRLKGYSLLSQPDSQYDAFVAFDTRHKAVADWVYNELRVSLEDKGRKRFKLCLEERDWLVGLSCIQNLYDAVYKSKKTVFVLTNGGSINGTLRQAFFMAQQRLLDEKVDVVVLVLLDEVMYKSKYLQMRKMLCRKSVLTWPRNPHSQPHFWDNMRATLTSDNNRYYDSNISESF